MTKAARPIVLLLTATVDPGLMTHVKRRDPRRRFKDYEQALKKWCRVPGFQSIIFCENSAFDISPLHKWTASAPEARTRVRFISFQGNDYPPHLGKGYGEMRILKHALSLASLEPDTLIMKVTGRYFVRNVDALLGQTRTQREFDVFCNVAPDGCWAHSVVFASTLSFFETHLFPFHERLDDSAGIYFEHVLADAIRAGMAAGLRWTGWCYPLRLSGVSGTLDRRFIAVRSGLERVKQWIIEKTYRLRHALGLYRRHGTSAGPRAGRDSAMQPRETDIGIAAAVDSEQKASTVD